MGFFHFAACTIVFSLSCGLLNTHNSTAVHSLVFFLIFFALYRAGERDEAKLIPYPVFLQSTTYSLVFLRFLAITMTTTDSIATAPRPIKTQTATGIPGF